MNKRTIAIYLTAIGLLLVLTSAWYIHAFVLAGQTPPIKFDGERALEPHLGRRVRPERDRLEPGAADGLPDLHDDVLPALGD